MSKLDSGRQRTSPADHPGASPYRRLNLTLSHKLSTGEKVLGLFIPFMDYVFFAFLVPYCMCATNAPFSPGFYINEFVMEQERNYLLVLGGPVLDVL